MMHCRQSRAWAHQVAVAAALLAVVAPTAWAQPSATASAVAPRPPIAVPVEARLPGPQPADPNAIRVLLAPELETTLVAQMVGRISTLNGSLGARVTKGRTIVSFDCSEASARLHMA